jgi:allophanate hydrolase
VAQLLYSGAWVVERYTFLKDFLASHPQQILPVLQTILNTALNYSASDVFTGFYRLAELQQQANLVWEKIDTLVVPTAGTIYRIAEVEANPIEFNTNLGYYTNFVNLLDLAAIALPAGFREDGLPFGITLIAPAFSEKNLCNLGKMYEKSRNSHA